MSYSYAHNLTIMRHSYLKFTSFLSHRLRLDVHYLIAGSFWLSLTQVITITCGVAVSAFFAQTLSTSDYGLYRYLISIGAIFASFSLTGLGQSILQASAKKYYQYYAETFRLNLFYSFGITLVGILGGLYYLYKGNLILAIGCIAIAFLQPLINTYQNVPAFLQGDGRLKETTLLQSTKVLITTAVSILAILITHDVIILFIILLGTQLTVNVLSHIHYKTKYAEKTPLDIFNKYLLFAKHTSLRNLVANTAFRFDTIVVFTHLGATELAVYTIANIIPEQIKGSFKNIASLLIPKYAQHADMIGIKKNILARSLHFFLILIVITIIYIGLAHLLYQVLFPKYESAIFYSKLAALSFPAFVLYMPLYALQSQLKEKELHLINTQVSVLQIVLVFAGVYAYGLLGVILSKTFCRYINMFLCYHYVYKKN